MKRSTAIAIVAAAVIGSCYVGPSHASVDCARVTLTTLIASPVPDSLLADGGLEEIKAACERGAAGFLWSTFSADRVIATQQNRIKTNPEQASLARAVAMAEIVGNAMEKGDIK